MTPTDLFPELAKFFKHLLAESYQTPRQYLICAPRGVGNDLFDLLAAPAAFKQRFVDDWRAGVTGLKQQVADLTLEQLALVQAFDFSTIVDCQLRDILEWHELDRAAHHALFGIVPERMEDPDAPPVPTKAEENYIQALLHVYWEFSGNTLTLQDLMESAQFAEHFHDQRTSFYCAEGLKTFSRDLYGEHEFVRLLDMVHAGVRSSVNSPKHTNGLARLEAGLTNSQTLKVNDSVLAPRLRPGDLPGTCHHLANEKRLKWVK
ncbi:ABC-three component system protein [Ideonella sp. YS5]|uniref:ABC-three component system protein n=1 Tax=Ideonella sp. YS5 TaxID=3453714 RepID=UPI003EEF1AAD